MGSMSQVKGATEKKVQVQVPISSSWCLESGMARYGGQVRWGLLVKEEAGNIKVNACMFFWTASTRQQKSAPQPRPVATWSSLPLTSRLWPGVLRVGICSLTSGGLSALLSGKGPTSLQMVTSSQCFTFPKRVNMHLKSFLIMQWKTLAPEKSISGLSEQIFAQGGDRGRGESL